MTPHSAHLAAVAQRDEPPSHVGRTPFTLGALVAIVVGGTVTVCIIFGLFWAWATKRQYARRAPRSLEHAIGVADGDGACKETKARNKLQKKCAPGHHEPSEEDDEEEDQADDKGRRFSTMRRVSLPVLPPIFTRRRSSFNPFGGGGRAEQGPVPRVASWIDEDALHGPTVKKQKATRRFSIRESWPLKQMVPTIPKLQQQAVAIHNQQHDLLVAGQVSGSNTAARCLPRPPRPVLVIPITHPAVVPPAAPYSFADPHGTSPTRKSGLLKAPGKNMRTASTESTLSMILRSTEQRLQEGGTSGVARRNQQSPTRKRDTTSQETLVGRSESADVLALYYSGSRTPSPTKTPQNYLTPTSDRHRRQVSQTSITSEPDSLFAEPSPGEVCTALTSPSRAKVAQVVRAQSAHSPASSLSSNLSTVYSEDELPEGTTQATSAHSSSILDDPKGGNRLYHSNSSDPFVSSSPGRQRTEWQLSSPTQNMAGLNRPQRLGKGLYGSNSSPTKGEDGHRSIQHSGLEQMSSNAAITAPCRLVSPDDEPRRQKETPTSLLTAPQTPNNTEASASTASKAAGTRPTLLITSPSTASWLSTPPSIQSLIYNDLRTGADSPISKKAVYPPPYELQAKRSSPTLGFNIRDIDEDSMPSLPGSPELRLIRPHPSVAVEAIDPPSSDDDNDSPILNRLRGSIRVIPTEPSFPAHIANAIKQPANPSKQYTPHVTQIPVPRHPVQVPDKTPHLTAAIAELRRMNSQVSAVSDSSSYYSAASTAPAAGSGLRGESGGAAITTTPGRRAGAKHYLALGSSNANNIGSPRRVVGGNAKGWEQENEHNDDNEDDDGSAEVMKGRRPLFCVHRAAANRQQVEVVSPPRRPASNVAAAVGGSPLKTSPERQSEDSLGLYDMDGFLISSPIRG